MTDDNEKYLIEKGDRFWAIEQAVKLHGAGATPETVIGAATKLLEYVKAESK